jgi:hypothetical protein
MGYRGNGEDDRRFARCARCDAIAWAEPAGSCHTDANTVCALCGMNRADLPFANSDYFDVLMKADRPMRRVPRPRRSQ